MNASPYPKRPLRLIVGASAGSAADITARAIAPALAARLQSDVQVELLSTQEGAAAAQTVARSPADGGTLLMTSMHIHAISPTLHPDLPYDVIKDFTPVSLVARCPLVLAVYPDIAAHSLAELSALARTQPKTLTYASSATGGSPHLAAVLYEKMAGVEMKHVCYERTQRLYADLVDGRISLSFNNIMSMLPLLSAGKLRGLAVTGAARTPSLPNLPTVAESGLPGYEVINWLGIVAPAGVAPEIVKTLSDEIAAALGSSDAHQALRAGGMEAVGSTADEFALHIRSELAKWAPIVKERIAHHGK